jgi:hypothetical protein
MFKEFNKLLKKRMILQMKIGRTAGAASTQCKNP